MQLAIYTPLLFLISTLKPVFLHEHESKMMNAIHSMMEGENPFDSSEELYERRARSLTGEPINPLDEPKMESINRDTQLPGIFKRPKKAKNTFRKYIKQDECANHNFEIREWTPRTVIADLEEMFEKAKCDFLFRYGVYPYNVAEDFDMCKPYSYDIVMIGTSAAAISSLKTLSQLGMSILMIEAGFMPPVRALSLYYRPSLLTSEYAIPKQASIPNTAYPKTVYAANVLGGMSTLDNNEWNTGTTKDYEKWGSISKKWGYEKMSEHFRSFEESENITETCKEIEKEEIVGADGKISYKTRVKETVLTKQIKKAFKEAGYSRETGTLNGENDIEQKIDLVDRQPGVDIVSTLNDQGNLELYAEKVFKQINDKSNIHLAMVTRVSDVIFEGNRAVAVRVITPDGFPLEIKINHQLILTNHPVDTVTLLTVSGVGEPRTLEELNIPPVSSLPYMGAELKFVPTYYGLFVRCASGSLISEHDSDEAGLGYLFGNTQNGEAVTLESYKAYLSVAESEDANVQVNLYVFSKFMMSRLKSLMSGLFQYDAATQRYISELVEFYDILIVAPQLLESKSFGSVKVIKDGFTARQQIDTGLYAEEEDMEVMLEAIDVIRNLVKTTSLGGKSNLEQVPVKACAGYEPFSLDYNKCSLRHLSNPNLHPTGGCIMGDNPETSVVDEDLGVHGLDNVKVFSLATVPAGIASDTSALGAMIGMNGANLLAKAIEDIKQEE